MPVAVRLTPHGLRHSHKTWMAEDGIPEILAEQRLGHQVPGIRGIYAHATTRMRNELTAALQARWEAALRSRAALNPRSPSALLDGFSTPAAPGRANRKCSRPGPGIIIEPAVCSDATRLGELVS